MLHSAGSSALCQHALQIDCRAFQPSGCDSRHICAPAVQINSYKMLIVADLSLLQALCARKLHSALANETILIGLRLMASSIARSQDSSRSNRLISPALAAKLLHACVNLYGMLELRLMLGGLRDMWAAASGGIGSEPILVWLMREAPDVLLCAVVTATAALWWPDDSVGVAARFCRSVGAACCLCMFIDLQSASATPAGRPQCVQPI